jgi:hypothetical protein
MLFGAEEEFEYTSTTATPDSNGAKPDEGDEDSKKS